MKYFTDMEVPLVTTDSVDPLTFPLAPAADQGFHRENFQDRLGKVVTVPRQRFL